MRQQGITTIENVRDCVSLVLAELDFRGHAVKGNMAAVKLAGSGGIEQLVVARHQRFPSGRVTPNPFCKGVLNSLLLLLGKGGFFLVQHALFLAFCIQHRVIDAHVPQVQRILEDAVAIGAVGAVGHISGDVIASNHGLAFNVPFCGVR